MRTTFLGKQTKRVQLPLAHRVRIRLGATELESQQEAVVRTIEVEDATLC